MCNCPPISVIVVRILMKCLSYFRKIMYSDLQSISPEQYMKQITKRLTELHAVSVSILKIYLCNDLFV